VNAAKLDTGPPPEGPHREVQAESQVLPDARALSFSTPSRSPRKAEREGRQRRASAGHAPTRIAIPEQHLEEGGAMSGKRRSSPPYRTVSTPSLLGGGTSVESTSRQRDAT
jgi:hypothetical protein